MNQYVHNQHVYHVGLLWVTKSQGQVACGLLNVSAITLT